MDYQTFVSTELIPRILAAFNDLKANLVAAGVAAGNITVEEVTDGGNNDMRYRITARKGAKTFIAYVELTAAGVINGQMALVITLYSDGNGSQISTSYVPGAAVAYNVPASMDSLIIKLGQVETICLGELRTAARAFLGV